MSTEPPSALASLEHTLPRASYLDAAAFQREYAAIFECGWVCVGRRDTLTESGDYLAIRLQEQSLLVIKSDNGDLGAFYNVCRHRGTELVPLKDTGPISGQFSQSIVCPYHAWSYHLDGRLRGTPHLAIETDGVSLHSIPLAEWGGFIFICLAPNHDEPLATTLGDGTARLQRYPLADLRVGHTISYDV